MESSQRRKLKIILAVCIALFLITTLSALALISDSSPVKRLIQGPLYERDKDAKPNETSSTSTSQVESTHKHRDDEQMSTGVSVPQEVMGQSYYSLTPSQEYNPLFLPIHHGTEGDWFPDLEKEATIMVNASGRWSDIFPQPLKENDVVFIPEGIEVIYDEEGSNLFRAVVVQGSLKFDPAKDTKMHVGTIAVYEGDLEIKPQSSKTAEVDFTGEINTVLDPAQVELGILAACTKDCKIDIEGNDEDDFSQIQVSQSSTKLTTTKKTSWQRGQVLALADTQSPPTGIDPASYFYTTEERKFPQQFEYATIESVNGNEVTLEDPVKYSHLSYAAMVSRNVMLKTDKEQTSDDRAHIMLAGHVEATVRNVQIVDMGRTTTDNFDDTTFNSQGKPTHVGQNQRGRYALHAHHLHEPFLFEGNAILGSPKWGIVNHDSYGNIRSNIVIGAQGAGIVAEDGLETGTVKENLVIGTGGGSAETDDNRFGLTNGKDMAHSGFGYWFRGPFMEIEDNIAAGYFKASGFGFFLHPAFTKSTFPIIEGMPLDLIGTTSIEPNARQPLRKFEGNIADGVFGVAGLSMEYSVPVHEIRNLTVITRGNSSAYGVALTHVNSLVLRDSNIQGATGTERTSSPIYKNSVNSFSAPGTQISGFAVNSF